MSLIQAIQTVYTGYKFRSRLEARWAVFFDSLGLDWRYEDEGFDLGGVWYLPDFWIESWQRFIEIKPENLSFDEFDKCVRLAVRSQKDVIAIQGQPWIGEYSLNYFDSDRLEDESTDLIELGHEKAKFGRCRKCKCVFVLADDGSFAYKVGQTCCASDKWPLGEDESSELKAAFRAARQARFDGKE